MDSLELKAFLNQLEENNRRIDKEIENLKLSNLKWEAFLFFIGLVTGVLLSQLIYAIMEIRR